MAIPHMGQLVEQRAKEKNLSKADVGRLINRSRQAIPHIYKRAIIDNVLLLKFCEVLEADFFAVFYLEGFLKEVRDKEKGTAEIERLRKDLEEQKGLVDTFKAFSRRNSHIWGDDKPSAGYSKAVKSNEQARSVLSDDKPTSKPKPKRKKRKPPPKS